MAISAPSVPATSRPLASGPRVAPAAPADRTQGVEPSRQQLQQQSNAAILQASQQVSLQMGNEPLALLYTAAIDAINEKLAPDLGENALQRGLDDGLDISPEATAERIVSLTTGMFGRFQEGNSELSFSDQVNRFVEIISAGIEQGFNEAREILDGLDVLEGDIATNIDSTFDLVQQGLQAFSDRHLGKAEAGQGLPE